MAGAGVVVGGLGVAVVEAAAAVKCVPSKIAYSPSAASPVAMPEVWSSRYPVPGATKTP